MAIRTSCQKLLQKLLLFALAAISMHALLDQPKFARAAHETFETPLAIPDSEGYDLTDPANNVLLDFIIPNVIQILYGVRQVGPGDATIILRWTMMLTLTWYDTSTPWHPTAVGVYSDLGRRSVDDTDMHGEMTTALLFASHKVLTWLGPEHAEVWDQVLSDLGLDPTDEQEGTGNPIAIGNSAAAAIIAARTNDGFNQFGDADGRKYNLQPFSDYTGYVPTNSPYEVTDARLWQPQLVTNPLNGLTRAQAFVTPQYRLTTPFTYSDPSQFSAPEPSKSYDVSEDGTLGDSYRQQVDEVLEVSANLTDEQKMAAEYFDDKIFSLGFSILHSTITFQLDLTEFVHMDFVTNLAAFDTGIAIWNEKAKWNAVRPFTAVREVYGDTDVTAWGGPGVGTVDDITGNEWSSYRQTADHPEYPSASASFCTAHAVTARLFLGTDEIHYHVDYAAGASLIEPGITPATDITLDYHTWTDFDRDCGESRVWGGVHFPDAVPAGQAIGNEIGLLSYQFFLDHVNNEGVAGSLRGVGANPGSGDQAASPQSEIGDIFAGDVDSSGNYGSYGENPEERVRRPRDTTRRERDTTRRERDTTRRERDSQP